MSAVQEVNSLPVAARLREAIHAQFPPAEEVQHFIVQRTISSYPELSTGLHADVVEGNPNSAWAEELGEIDRSHVALWLAAGPLIFTDFESTRMPILKQALALANAHRNHICVENQGDQSARLPNRRALLNASVRKLKELDALIEEYQSYQAHKK